MITPLAPVSLPLATLRVAKAWAATTQEEWFSCLRDHIAWEQAQLQIYGKSVLTPRLTSWHGDASAVYRYSGAQHLPHGWTPLLDEIRRAVEVQCDCSFNSVLLNYYRDGKDKVGWHSDSEAELGPDPIIASLSLGGTRFMDFRPIGGGPRALRLTLAGGDLLVMSGQTQSRYQHCIPAQAKADPRINLTFRTIRSLNARGAA